MHPLRSIVRYLLLAGLLWLAGLSAVSAQSVKRLYLANDDHTDYMWTKAQYDSAFVHMLD